MRRGSRFSGAIRRGYHCDGGTSPGRVCRARTPAGRRRCEATPAPSAAAEQVELGQTGGAGVEAGRRTWSCSARGQGAAARRWQTPHAESKTPRCKSPEQLEREEGGRTTGNNRERQETYRADGEDARCAQKINRAQISRTRVSVRAAKKTIVL